MSPVWPTIVAALILTVGAIAIVQVPGDPLSMPMTVALTSVGPLACGFALSVTPSAAASSVLVTWVHGGAVAIYTFMCVRGRRVAPWIGLAAEAAIFAWWGHSVGHSMVSSAGLVAIDAAPLIMATLFSFTLRPTAKEVFALRSQTMTQVGQLAAETAATEERLHQVRFLDQMARPLLERIASGDELTAAERTECELLEAHLRDRLRAPLMSTLNLDDPAYRARTRGVEVVFIDDSRADSSGGVDVDSRVAAAVEELASEVLDAADHGQVFVRVSAPDRPIAASVLRRGTDGSSVRSEIDQTGRIRSYS
ncbi:hypothetical protein AAFP30_11655 [Gordonia sp. CPCC 205515]|uniref:hypothetical protein n=1 Tax=Gordonia sp. CPCC 205515 TaxID=3140791 RepID=UPI003AF36D2E